MTKGFAGRGRVREVLTARLAWTQGEDGRPAMQERPGTEERLPADMVLLALGFTGPEPELASELALDLDERGNVKARYGSFLTSRPGVFAAGDMRSGQSLVVRAIGEGRGAAREIDRTLMGDTELP
jgi:glutamate synthase (NADPH/NADH) small chain